MELIQNKDWCFEGETDPLKGPKGDTAFLKDNYRLLGPGGVFRTPKARFSPAQIHAGARKAGFIVQITEEGPWNKVTVLRRLSPAPKTKDQQQKDQDLRNRDQKLFDKALAAKMKGLA